MPRSLYRNYCKLVCPSFSLHAMIPIKAEVLLILRYYQLLLSRLVSMSIKTPIFLPCTLLASQGEYDTSGCTCLANRDAHRCGSPVARINPLFDGPSSSGLLARDLSDRYELPDQVCFSARFMERSLCDLMEYFKLKRAAKELQCMRSELTTTV